MIVSLALATVAAGCHKAGEMPGQSTPPADAQPAPARTIIRDAAQVITMDPALGQGPLGILENADVVFEEDRIVAVGQKVHDVDGSGATALDATGKIVMPGFVDVHNHLWQSLIRGCGADKDLLGWLPACVQPMNDAGITEDEAYAAVRLSTYALVDTGVTTVVDDGHSFTEGFVRGNLRALDHAGLRYVYAYCGEATSFDHARGVAAALAATPLAGFQVCSHPAASLIEPLTDATGLAAELGVYLNVHLLENIGQRADRAIEALIQAGSFDGKLLVNHAIHVTDEEIALLARSDVRVAHNPLSNMRLASGIIRMEALRAAGIKIGLGLDGGANDTSDVFANMRAAVGLQRAKTLNAAASPTVAEVVRMATLGGAEVLDMEDIIGSLTPGKQADIIVIDPAAINFAPRWDLLNQIVFNGQPRNVEHVFVAGKALKSAGQVLERRSVCLTERNRAVASRPRRDEGAGWLPATEEQRRDAPQIRDFATEGKPIGALGDDQADIIEAVERAAARIQAVVGQAR